MNQPLAESNISAQQQDIVLYQSTDGEVEFHVNVFDESVWLTQKQMAELFDTTVQNTGQHANSIFKEGELIQISVIKDFFITASDGKQYKTKHYNEYRYFKRAICLPIA
jgi:hypothetical protein